MTIPVTIPWNGRPRMITIPVVEWERLTRIQAAAIAYVAGCHDPAVTALSLQARWRALQAAVDAPQAPTGREGEGT